MEANGTISTRGLKPDAIQYCELIFDINPAYFDNHGGYEFAKQFYADASKLPTSPIFQKDLTFPGSSI